MALCAGAATTALGTLLTSINGATFELDTSGPAGSGFIHPFLRIHGNGPWESGYNTSAASPPQNRKVLDNVSGSFTRDLPLSELLAVEGHYVFLLDINQNGQNEGQLSLNQLEVFFTSTPGQSGGSTSAQTGRFIPSTFSDYRLIYDLNSDTQPRANSISVPSVTQGSSHFNLTVTLASSLFGTVPEGCYLVLYSQFGRPGGYPSTGGYEEWSVLSRAGVFSAGVPEPSAVIAALLLLSAFSASLVRVRRNKQMA